MRWSVCRMLFESRAEAYEASKAHRESQQDDVRYATEQDVSNWI